jgi:eukaryotic translation initiation factor 2C
MTDNTEEKVITFKPFSDAAPNTLSTFDVSYFDRHLNGPGNPPDVYAVQLVQSAPPLPTAPLKALMTNPTPQTKISSSQSLEYEDVLNMIVRRYAGLNPTTTTAAKGTKAFPISGNGNNHAVLGGGLVAWRGCSQRARLLQNGICLMLAPTASAMYLAGPLQSLINAWQNDNRHSGLLFLNQFAKGVKVRATWGRQNVKRVYSILPPEQHSENTTFDCESHPVSGNPIPQGWFTVGWYFLQAYNIALKKDALLNVGDRKRPVYWPIRLSTVVPGQGYRGFLPATMQTQAMIKFACRGPDQNLGLVVDEGMKMYGLQGHQGPAMQRFVSSPLQIKVAPLVVEGRRLPSPTLVFGNGTIGQNDTSRGQWMLKNYRFVKPPNKEQTPYAVVVLRRQKDGPVSNLASFRSMLANGLSRRCGISTPSMTDSQFGNDWIWPSPSTTDLTVWLAERLNKLGMGGVRYVFFLINDRNFYRHIKAAGDQIGMGTQCAYRKNDRNVKDGPADIDNLSLKYSMKCGGINWSLKPENFESLIGNNTMLIGIDVVHPPPGAKQGSPSVAGLVHSVQPSAGQFLPVLQLMPPVKDKASQEILTNITPLIETAMSRWKARNKGNLPSCLFICRDGVSDTQLQTLLDVELPGIQEGVRKVYGGGPSPRIFVLNTQKRHFCRFFRCTDDKSTAFDPKNNPLPGLIIDRSIVSRTRDDWYHVGHKCLQGTSRPAHHVRVVSHICSNILQIHANFPYSTTN